MKTPANPFTAAYTGMLMASSQWFAAWRDVADRNERERKQAERLKRRPSSPKMPRPAHQATAR